VTRTECSAGRLGCRRAVQRETSGGDDCDSRTSHVLKEIIAAPSSTQRAGRQGAANPSEQVLQAAKSRRNATWKRDKAGERRKWAPEAGKKREKKRTKV
jgi:hypothetical protein